MLKNSYYQLLIINDQNIYYCQLIKTLPNADVHLSRGPAGADDWLGGSSTKSKSHFGLLISVQDILDLTTDENFLNTDLVG